MIIQNKRTGIEYPITKKDWESIQKRGWAGRYIVISSDELAKDLSPVAPAKLLNFLDDDKKPEKKTSKEEDVAEDKPKKTTRKNTTRKKQIKKKT